MRYAELVGARVARRYLLVARLGEGPTGVCFAARDRTGRDVVVKLVERSRISDEDASRYIQAASTLAPLGGAHLVSTLDVAHDLELGLLLIVREPMRGFDVRTALTSLAPMEPRGALVLVAQACWAAASAHAAGALLLGIKPTNVFLEPGNAGEILVRICDAAVAPRLLVQGEGVAPELSTFGVQPDARCDVYSLGTLLYALLTGRAARAEDVAARPPLGECAPWIDPSVARLVEGALATDPSVRIAKASALGDALRDAAGGDSVLRPEMLVPVSAATLASRAAPHDKVGPTAQGARSERDRLGDPLIGHKLGGHYVIQRALGHGGMGSVYEVVSPDGEALAAKVVARKDGAQTQLFARFLREAQAATKILDAHVVRTVELGTDMVLGAPFMVMELLRGRDLASVLRERGALDPLVTSRIFLQAARGLAAAHRSGVVHRDVKPANIFLDVDGSDEVTIKICDFGLAKAIATAKDGSGSELTRAGAIIGTPSYMSPEHATGAQDVDARSDLWSLCASLYEALSGERLWANFAANGAELLHIICTRPFRPLDEVAPRVPPGLVGIVHRGLERDRNARWQDADSLVDALIAQAGGTERVGLEDLRPAARPPSSSLPIAPRESGHSASPLAPLPLDRSTQAFEQPVVPVRATERAASEAIQATPSRRAKWPRATIVGVAAAVASAVALVALAPGRRSRGVVSAAPLGSAASSASAPATACESNAQCTREIGRAAMCSPQHACVALDSDECVVRIPASDAVPDDATIWIGTMFPGAGEGFDTLWGPAAKTVELAVRDFNDILGGIPDPRPGRPVRRLGLIACDDSDDGRATRAAHHLAVALRVPAVIGFRSSKEVINLSASEFLPQGVLAVATFNKSSLISSIPHPDGSPRLVWRLAPSNAEDAAPLCALISEVLEPELRAGPLGPRAPMRVAVVRPDSATGVGFEDGLLARLRYNGKPLAENGDNFQELVFDEGSRDPLSGLVEKLLAFRPHVIAYPGGIITARLTETVERRWPATTRPWYVFGMPLQDAELQRLVEKRPNLARRVVGISTPAAAIPNVKLAAHYNQAFGADQSATTTTPNAYDALYVLAYAAIAAGDVSLTGRGLARAIERLLPPGEPLEVGPAHILEAYNALRAGKRVDLLGASGPLDFDATTGDAQFDYAFECLTVEHGRTRRAETPLRFELRAQRLSGSFSCR